jgi:hypothetical protein
MEAQTITNAKLEKAESFLQQIPEDIRTLFQFSASPYERQEMVILSCRASENNFIGMDVARITKLSVHQLTNQTIMVSIETAGSNISLYSNGMSHITVY